MTQVDKLRIFFVLPSDDAREEDCSTDMQLVSQMVSKYGGYTEKIKPSNCINHVPQEKDVFVFDKFEGKAFETLKKNSSKILGIRCLLTCITNGRSIPPSLHPVLTEGMRNLWITCSGFDQATKKQIQEKVQYMSGNYDNSLRSIITHLVAHNNISSKAIHAYKSNIKIMKLSWIEDVWQQSLVKNVNGGDQNFQHHISPLFHNLNITTSGIPKREKDILKGIIQSNGGRFMGTLEGNVTNIVLLNKPEGEKYKFAKSWSITCVKPQWVHDCIKASAIMSFKTYLVDDNPPKSSTPNKENCTANFTANFTANLSAITNLANELDKQVTHLNETATTTISGKSDLNALRTVNNGEQSNASSKGVKHVKSSNTNIINNVLLRNVKDAGQFLDGLSIFLCGFNSEDTEKLKRILNKGGATRLNEMSESVTHVISGKNDCNLGDLAKFGAYILSVDWLVESMKMKSPADERKFLLVNSTSNPLEPPSPMSKQGAQLLSRNEEKCLSKPHFSFDEKNQNEKLSQLDELVCRYNASQPGEPLNQPGSTKAPGTSTNFPTGHNQDDFSVTKSSNLSIENFFKGLTFFLSNDLSEEDIKLLEELITEQGGQIVRKRDLGVPDYAIVPVVGASLQEVTAKEVVNIYFIKDCCIEGYLLTPRYYHQPVAYVKNATPLKNCVISVSNYVQGEREFVEMMIETLGGVAQSLLARKPKQGALKSTHLVCAETQGQKYNGAIRWGLPVVHHDWLLKCAALGIRVSEKPYLMGDSKISTETENKTSTEMTLPLSSKTNNFAELETNSGKALTDYSNADKTPSASQTNFTSRAEGFVPPCSKTTPVHNAVARVKATETPKSTGSNSPDPNRTVTPTSPYGAFYGKGSPTPTTRKRIWKWMNQGAEFPLDPPSKPYEPEESTTPVSELVSRHLEMLKRKPEELPPDSPAEIPFKRLNLDAKESDNQNKTSVVSGLEKMKKIEEKFTKNGSISPSVQKPKDSEGRQMVVVTESQAHTEVGWEDPAEKEAALANLEKAAEVEIIQPKVFMFSCIAELKEAKQVVTECGGVISQLPYFDKKATHLIAGNLTRAEKLMGSIAAGLWILHPSYIDGLKKAKSVNAISEEDYEWGSPKQKFRLNLSTANAKNFALCSHTWRMAIRNGESPAFKGLKILLHLSQPKYDSFKRLIEAGEGLVVKGQPPYNHDLDANLCVYEANNTEPINFESLARQNIRCVALVFISDVLLRKKDAIEKNLVPDFLKHWEKR